MMEKIKGNFNGVEKEYDVILTFHSNTYNKDYIVYTDNEYDTDDKLKIYAAVYNPNAEQPFVGYPTTQEEWDEIISTINNVLINEE